MISEMRGLCFIALQSDKQLAGLLGCISGAKLATLCLRTRVFALVCRQRLIWHRSYKDVTVYRLPHACQWASLTLLTSPQANQSASIKRV